MPNRAFLGLNVDLLNNPKYDEIKMDALVLYSLYADRAACSKANSYKGNPNFVDKNGRHFIIFTDKEASKLIRVSTKTIANYRKKLAGVGLIDQSVVFMGLKRINRIFVNDVEKTPKNVDLKLHWKNHTVRTESVASHWTTFAKLDWVKTIAKNVLGRVENSVTTDQKKGALSLSQTSLTQESLTDGHDTTTQAQTPVSEYRKLPEAIRTEFVNNFGFIPPMIAKRLNNLVENQGEDCVLYAIQKTSSRNVKSPIAYVESCLRNAANNGLKTVAEMMAFDQQYAQNKRNKAQKRSSQKPFGRKKAKKIEKLPDWAQKQWDSTPKPSQESTVAMAQNTEQEVTPQYTKTKANSANLKNFVEKSVNYLETQGFIVPETSSNDHEQGVLERIKSTIKTMFGLETGVEEVSNALSAWRLDRMISSL